MQFYAKKILDQFASERLGQFDWILHQYRWYFIRYIKIFKYG